MFKGISGWKKSKGLSLLVLGNESRLEGVHFEYELTSGSENEWKAKPIITFNGWIIVECHIQEFPSEIVSFVTKSIIQRRSGIRFYSRIAIESWSSEIKTSIQFLSTLSWQFRIEILTHFNSENVAWSCLIEETPCLPPLENYVISINQKNYSLPVINNRFDGEFRKGVVEQPI